MRPTTAFKSLSLALFLLASLAVGGAANKSHAQGLFGIGEMSAGGSVMFGDRNGGGGFGINAHFEYAAMAEETALGGYLGLEFLTELGYEQYGGTDPYGGEWTQGPLIFDMGVGFPVTLFKLGSGGTGTTLFTVGLGAGMSVQHAYGYVRARILTRLGTSSFLELMGRWTPSEASSDWTEDTGLDVYQARVSFNFKASETLAMQLFGEWQPADRTREARGDPINVAKWPGETTRAFQSILRVGLGFIF